MLLFFSSLPLIYVTSANAAVASSFAGSTLTALFPPANATITATDTFFLDASQVGYGGPTARHSLAGDEAGAIATAPAVAIVDSVFPLITPITSDKKAGFNVLRHFGSLSPFQSVESLGLPHTSALVPDGCKLTQMATDGVTCIKWFNLGIGFRVKYGELLKKATDLPVFRTTSEERMVDSALNFAAGFFGVQTYQNEYHQLIEIDDEEDDLPVANSTLAPWNCPTSDTDVGAFGSKQAFKWANIYLAPAQKRLAPFISGFNLTISALFDMQSLCSYETVALGYSVFCGLFTEEEWEGFSYLFNLEFWYGFGPGTPYASAMGIGWVQELVSRLTETRITKFDTSVNGTVVSSNVTFPFRQPIYVDATHDTVVSAIVTALNFTSLAANGPLPTDSIPVQQTYFASKISPFAANLVGQVLSCSATQDEPTHIRWVLNDAVVPLTGIKGCKESNDGLCELPDFISGMKQRIAEVDYAFDCFRNYTTPDPDNIIDGRKDSALNDGSDESRGGLGLGGALQLRALKPFGAGLCASDPGPLGLRTTATPAAAGDIRPPCLSSGDDAPSPSPPNIRYLAAWYRASRSFNVSPATACGWSDTGVVFVGRFNIRIFGWNAAAGGAEAVCVELETMRLGMGAFIGYRDDCTRYRRKARRGLFVRMSTGFTLRNQEAHRLYGWVPVSSGCHRVFWQEEIETTGQGKR
ncbi:histidine phosphatase superfamily [Mycena sp. CBHHK59/15]|nr:histidine phosphatase superfamily [Mycena sp. CBHHK59/15]